MDVLQDRRGYMWLATEDGLKPGAFSFTGHDSRDAHTDRNPGRQRIGAFDFVAEAGGRVASAATNRLTRRAS